MWMECDKRRKCSAKPHVLTHKSTFLMNLSFTCTHLMVFKSCSGGMQYEIQADFNYMCVFIYYHYIHYTYRVERY